MKNNTTRIFCVWSCVSSLELPRNGHIALLRASHTKYSATQNNVQANNMVQCGCNTNACCVGYLNCFIRSI